MLVVLNENERQQMVDRFIKEPLKWSFDLIFHAPNGMLSARGLCDWKDPPAHPSNWFLVFIYQEM